jgi:purine-cytosine permease-like protein
MLGNIKDIIQLLLNLITDEKIIIILTSVSIISLVLSIFITPYVIINIPEDYFISKRRVPKKGIVYLFTRIVKNLFGLFVGLIGLIMIFTPGQGLLFLLIGFIMLNFPGKYRLEKKLIKNKRIYIMINKIRKRHNQPPIRLDGLD